MAEAHEYNAGDEKHVKDAEQARKNERKQEIEDIRSILNHPSGVRFFRRLMEKGKVFHTTFTGSSQGMFLEGHRNLALMFFHDLVEAAPNKVADIMVVKKK